LDAAVFETAEPVWPPSRSRLFANDGVSADFEATLDP